MDDEHSAKMVSVTDKPTTKRSATAQARVKVSPSLMKMLKENLLKKGSVNVVAEIAGIQAAKQTSNLIPLCHPLRLTLVEVKLKYEGEDEVLINGRVECHGETGVEMEAMTAVSVAALTVYDMCKGVDKSIFIAEVKLLSKDGGKSGSWSRSTP